MKELPGDVFVAGQLSAEHIRLLSGQGVRAFVNNRPDGESPAQPASAILQDAAKASGADYAFVPMQGMLTPDVLAASDAAFADLPRPIVAFCASGMRSAALWAFSHAGSLGTDTVMDALNEAGFNLQQLRPQIEARLRSLG